MSKNDFISLAERKKLGGLEGVLKRAAVQSKPEWREATETKPRKKYEYKEFELQKQIAKYLEFQYPQVLFISNPINLNLTQAQRGMMAAFFFQSDKSFFGIFTT